MRYRDIRTILLILFCVAMSACSTESSNITLPSSPTAATATQTTAKQQPTPTVTTAKQTPPTPTAMPKPVIAYIGSNVSAFQALYGPHGDTSLKGSINWDLSKTEWFSITYNTAQGYVYDVDHYFYPANQRDNHQQDNVSFEVAHKTCSRFMPPDSVAISVNKTKPDPALTDGIQYVFKSKWLANQIKDTSFFYFDEGTGIMADKYNTPVDPGTYTLFSIGSEQSGYEMCYLTTGISWPY